EVVAVPVRFNLGAVQYNRRLVAEAGLDENNPPKTWAEMEVWAKALTKVENGRVTQIGLTAETIDWMLQEVMFANGGDWVNSTLTEYAPDVDALVGGLAWMDRLVNDLKVMNIPASVAWTGTTDNLEGGRQSLASETAAMLIGYSSPGTVLSMNPDLDIALFPIPKGPLGEGKPVKISTGYDGWHVVQPAKNPRESYLFAKFFVENYSQEYALAAYSFPARAKSLDSYREDPMYAKMVDHLLESPVRNFHVFPARLDVRSEEPTMVQNVLARRATPEAAVRTFKQHTARVFAQNKSVLETFASRHGLVW
ncbi:MAG: extracellular solute-binding protein, partial [Spirochaetia bacterium]|nr:extracellular solute-binding protein [Spirochaetia bacterium]